jgi:TRAP transporter 4TM/12TM fusion protein
MVPLLYDLKRKPRTGEIPWYDILLILVNLIGPIYIIVNYKSMYFAPPVTTTLQSVFTIITALSVCEAMRRTVGPAMVILAVAFFLYGLFSSHLPGILTGPPVRLGQMLSYVYYGSDGIFGNILGLGATYVIAFLVFGAFLRMSGAGEFFIKLAFSLVGQLRGGPAKVAVVAAALFGTMTGSPAANIGVSGTITIPMMKKMGYSATLASAIESVASVGGILMPPVMGIVAFVMAQNTGLGYGAVIAAAVLPAILYYLSLFIQVDREAYLANLRGLPKEEMPSFTKTLKEGWHLFLPVVVLVVFLVPLHYDPSTAAIYSIVAVIIVSAFKKKTRLGPRKILNALEQGPRMACNVGPIMAILGLVTAGLTVSNLINSISSALIDLAAGNVLVLVLICGALCYLLGFGVDAIVAYILLSSLIAPAMVAMGLSVMAAHMFIFYMGSSTFITPPNAPAVFVAAAVGEAPMFPTAFRAMRLGIICFIVPFIFVFKPALLLIGTPLQIIEAVVTSIIGVASLACGVEGYLFSKTSWLERILLIAGGVVLMVPGWMFDVAGIAILATPLIWQWRKRQSAIAGTGNV